jgi:tetratricopeptide (TPR) repeat protein
MQTPLVLVCLVLASTLTASAQKPGGGSGGRAGVTSRPRIDIPDPNANTPTFLSGEVVMDDGSALTNSVTIQTVCQGKRRTETHTDSHGNFFFQLGRGFATTNNPEYEVDADSTSKFPARRSDSRNLQDCDLQASLAGFSSDVVQLGARFSGSESANIGRLVLHRVGNVKGFTISVTTAQTPEAARKALEKGREQIKKSKWDDAQKSFEKAVFIYPNFAVAWFELGQVQLHKNDPVGARGSFQHSIAADSKYINPYHSLAQLALRDQNWRELTEFSEKLLALNSVSFPEFWLWNSLGNYCLRNLATAEKSARRGLDLDLEHNVPRLEYVLGMVLLKKPDYQQAAQHLRVFLGLAATPVEVAEAQKQLEEIARLSPATDPPSQKR